MTMIHFWIWRPQKHKDGKITDNWFHQQTKSWTSQAEMWFINNLPSLHYPSYASCWMYVTLSAYVNVSLPGCLTASICGLPCLFVCCVCVSVCVCVCCRPCFSPTPSEVQLAVLFFLASRLASQNSVSFVERERDGVCATAVGAFAHVKDWALQAFWECRLNITSCSYSGLRPWTEAPRQFRASCLDRPQMTKDE